MFRVNYAKQGVLFPEQHPYFAKLPQNVRNEVQEQAEEAQKQDKIEKIKAIFDLDIKDQYKTIKTYDNGESKGKIEQHLLVDKNAPDYPSVLEAADYFAKQGKEVKMLPIVLTNAVEGARTTILPGVKENKNPDLLVNEQYVEVKEVQSKKFKTIKTRIKKAIEQADIIVLFIPKNSDETLKKYIEEKEQLLPINIIMKIKKE